MKLRSTVPCALVPMFVALVLTSACTPDESPGGLTLLDPVAGDGSGEPRLTSAPGGDVVLSWIEPSGNGESESFEYSMLRDGTWSEPVTVAERDDLFVNWADLPSVVRLGEQRWAAHFLVLQPESYAAYDIEYTVSSDGQRWHAPQRLNADAAEAEHGFVTLFDWDGAIGAVWLDGRRIARAAAGSPADGGLAGVELRYARLADDGSVTERGIVDELACDCCKTAVAATRSGPVLAYRDRSAEEIRDVVVRRFENEAWSAPERLGNDGWHIEGCPVNGPAIAAVEDSVAVAWFTGADGSPRVQLAWSKNGGRAFGAAIEVDGAGAFGQADVALLDADRAVVSWWRRAEGGGIVLAARRVDSDGTLGPVREIARSEYAQPLDVPQLERTGEGLVFAWTSYEDGLSVRTAYSEGWF